jgi:hypothetical protein
MEATNVTIEQSAMDWIDETVLEGAEPIPATDTKHAMSFLELPAEIRNMRSTSNGY